MSNKITIKRSSVTGKVPEPGDLDYGEFALNYTDGNLFFKSNANVITNLASTKFVSVTGNVTSGNVVTLGTVSAAGNITGNYFVGNGSQLTGITAEGGKTTFSSSPPSSPSQGDVWIDADTGIQYVYFNDGSSSQWAEMEAAVSISSGGSSGNVNFDSVSSNILPADDVTYDLGSATNRWRDIYLSGNTINLGGATIKTDAASGAIALIPEPTESNPNPSGMVVSPSGGITVVSTVGGAVSGNAISDAAASPTAAPVPIDIITVPPTNGQALIWDAANSEFIPGNVAAGSNSSSVTVYGNISSLPLANVTTGSMAFVSSNNRLYLWNGTGWFNIALINTNPTITGGANSTYVFAADGTPIVLTLTASDPEGIPLTWSYQITSGVLGNTATITQSDNVFTFTPSTNDENAGVFEVTFSASDGVNLGTASSTFTLAFGAADPYYTQSILMSTSTTDNGTNNTFLDSSGNDVTITRNGNVTQGTFSPFDPAGWSGYFDGTGDYLSSVVGASLDVPADTNFTVEGWCYLNARTATRPAIFSNYNSFTTGGLSFWAGHGSSTVTQFQVGLNGTFPALNAGTIPYNSWFHWAIVRNGTDSNNITVYINGTSIGTISSNAAITATGNNLWLGASGDAVANAGINGYMSNFRWVTGTAVYTASFTPPPQPLSAISGTAFLALNSNRFIDASSNEFAITVTGTPAVSPYAPFRPRYEYNPTDNGGSAYFDGTADWLSGTVTAARTGDFTFESWVYVTNLSAGRLIFTTRSGNTLDGFQVILDSGGVFRVGYQSVNFINTPSNTGTAGQWYHVAVTRASGNIVLWINGVNLGSSARGNDFTNTTFRLGYSAENLLPMLGYISNARYVVGTALYTSTFTPPTEPLTAVSGTALLVNSTNANIYDQTGKVVAETIGNAKTSTAVVKYGSTSMVFNGSSDYITIPNSNLVNFGDGNFTVEAWIYPTAATGEHGIVSLYGYSSNRRAWYMALNATRLEIRLSGVGTTTGLVTLQSSLGAVTTNQWQYVTIVRNGNTVTGYVNGVSVTSGSFSGTVFNNVVDPVVIGAVGPTITGYFSGYISDVRITKGVARYTANFTPPTAQLGFNNAE